MPKHPTYAFSDAERLEYLAAALGTLLPLIPEPNCELLRYLIQMAIAEAAIARDGLGGNQPN